MSPGGVVRKASSSRVNEKENDYGQRQTTTVHRRVCGLRPRVRGLHHAVLCQDGTGDGRLPAGLPRLCLYLLAVRGGMQSAVEVRGGVRTALREHLQCLRRRVREAQRRRMQALRGSLSPLRTDVPEHGCLATTEPVSWNRGGRLLRRATALCRQGAHA